MKLISCKIINLSEIDRNYESLYTFTVKIHYLLKDFNLFNKFK